MAPAQEDLRTFSWASVTSKNLPPSGAVPVTGTPPHVVKVPASQPRPESKPDSQIPPQRPQRDQRVREQRINIPPQRGPGPNHKAGEPEDVEPRRMVRHPNSHQLFFGNLTHEVDKSELKDFFQNYGNVVELRINSGGKLPNFGFVVFDDSEPVQNTRPIMFPGVVRLNVEEKTGAAREGDLRDNRLQGPGGPLWAKWWYERPSPRRHGAETRLWCGQGDYNSKAVNCLTHISTQHTAPAPAEL